MIYTFKIGPGQTAYGAKPWVIIKDFCFRRNTGNQKHMILIGPFLIVNFVLFVAKKMLTQLSVK